MQLDFLPEPMKRKRDSVRVRIIFAYVIVGVCVLLAGIWYLNNIKLKSTNDELAQVDSKLKSMDNQLAQLHELEKQLSSLRLIQRIDASLGTSINAIDILQELGTIVPPNMALTNLMIETKPVDVKFKPASTGRTSRAVSSGKKKKVNRVRLVITGISNDNVTVANFIANLSGSRLFEEVNMGYSKVIKFRGKDAKEFQANCYVIR